MSREDTPLFLKYQHFRKIKVNDNSKKNTIRLVYEKFNSYVNNYIKQSYLYLA